MTSKHEDSADHVSKTDIGANDADLSEHRDTPTPPETVIGWTCPKCGTDIELLQDVCWNCLYNPSAC